MKSQKKLPRKEALGAKVIYAALQILEERGGEAPNREVIREVGRRVTLNDWEKETLAKSGDERWRVILNIDSIYCVKAGFLIRDKGVWRITPEGQKAIQHGEVNLYKDAKAAYQKWKGA